jgi:hypothetical protein
MDNKELQGAHLGEAMPVVMPTHATHHLDIHYMFYLAHVSILADGTYTLQKQTFDNAEEAKDTLYEYFGIPRSPRGYHPCGLKDNLALRIVTADGKVRLYDVQSPTSILVVGCVALLEEPVYRIP